MVPAAMVPEHVPGGNPVMEVPGQVPQLPVITVAPVLLRLVAAMAAKVSAAPKRTGKARFSMTWAGERGRRRRRANRVLMLSEVIRMMMVVWRTLFCFRTLWREIVDG